MKTKQLIIILIHLNIMNLFLSIYIYKYVHTPLHTLKSLTSNVPGKLTNGLWGIYIYPWKALKVKTSIELLYISFGCFKGSKHSMAVFPFKCTLYSIELYNMYRIEMVAVLAGSAGGLQSVINMNLFIDKICRNNLNYR